MPEETILIVGILIPLIVLVISILAALEMSAIARMKGHDSSKYFWWCFLAFPFGAAMVIALPDRVGNAPETPVINDKLPDL